MTYPPGYQTEPGDRAETSEADVGGLDTPEQDATAGKTPGNEPNGEEWETLDELEVLRRVGRELYALRYSPVPTGPGSAKLMSESMEVRREMWDQKASDDEQQVWMAIAGDLLDRVFDR